jgi:SAM-dependent methyltransferase
MPTAEDRTLAAIIAAAARAYAPAGRIAAHFARGKLRHDPVFRAILARGLVPDGARLVDLGCGQGVLIAFLLAARARFEAGGWPQAWPPPPRLAAAFGFDLRVRAIAAARRALGDRAVVGVGDVRDAAIPPCDVIAILDVLHYLPPEDQARVLARCAAALAPGGRLLLRIGDAEAGVRAAITRLADQAITLARGGSPRLYMRGLQSWLAAVAQAGFRAEAAPMSAGTPFANVLLVARPAR